MAFVGVAEGIQRDVKEEVVVDFCGGGDGGGGVGGVVCVASEALPRQRSV